MHIIHINLAKGFRGGENQTLLLIEALHKHGIRQTLVCRKNGECQKRAEEAGFITHPVTGPLAGHWKFLGGDLVHVHDGRSVYWAWLEHFFSKTPFIVTRRIAKPISQRRLTHKAYRDAAALAAVSADSARVLSMQVTRPITVILDAYTEHAVDQNAVIKLRSQLGEGPVIGHIGALIDYQKAQSVLIKSFHKIKDRFPDAKLVLVGDGPDKQRFVQLAKHEPRIIFAGFQKNIGDWLSCFDIFAFPSYEEGLGSSVLDAMAMNIPVVAANAGGLPELVGNNERGTVIESHEHHVWADVLEHMLLNPEDYVPRTQAGYHFAQQHNAAAMAESYLALYKKIMENPTRGEL